MSLYSPTVNQSSSGMKVVLLPELVAASQRNMNIDEAMLDVLAECNFAGIARLYKWEAPALSLGRNQHTLPDNWQHLVTDYRLHVVSRPTGGRAVLHLNELTIALAFRTDALGCGGGSRVRCLHKALLPITTMLMEASGTTVATGAAVGNRDNRFDCFQAITEADVVDTRLNTKAAGAALVIRGGLVLQQVSVRSIQVTTNHSGQLPQFVIDEFYPGCDEIAVVSMNVCLTNFRRILSHFYEVVTDNIVEGAIYRLVGSREVRDCGTPA